jgi:hypothetical protein
MLVRREKRPHKRICFFFKSFFIPFGTESLRLKRDSQSADDAGKASKFPMAGSEPLDLSGGAYR